MKGRLVALTYAVTSFVTCTAGVAASDLAESSVHARAGHASGVSPQYVLASAGMYVVLAVVLLVIQRRIVRSVDRAIGEASSRSPLAP